MSHDQFFFFCQFCNFFCFPICKTNDEHHCPTTPICPARWCPLLANPQFPCLRNHHRPQQRQSAKPPPIAPTCETNDDHHHPQQRQFAKPATILAISSLPLPSPPVKALNSVAAVSSSAPLWSQAAWISNCGAACVLVFYY
ncbi:hypothetical protein SESBI_39615 [Sesbania bispinosa]|nr:hypothetical protein SESBI_39615 [Sesbania bispinosa]